MRAHELARICGACRHTTTDEKSGGSPPLVTHGRAVEGGRDESGQSGVGAATGAEGADRNGDSQNCERQVVGQRDISTNPNCPIPPTATCNNIVSAGEDDEWLVIGQTNGHDYSNAEQSNGSNHGIEDVWSLGDAQEAFPTILSNSTGGSRARPKPMRQQHRENYWHHDRCGRP